MAMVPKVERNNGHAALLWMKGMRSVRKKCTLSQRRWPWQGPQHCWHQSSTTTPRKVQMSNTDEMGPTISLPQPPTCHVSSKENKGCDMTQS